MRILRLVLVFSLAVSLVVAGIVAWIQTPMGARAVSGWLTARLQPSAPGTRVELENLKLHWPPALTVEQAVWKDSGDGTLVTLKSGHASLNRFRFPPNKTTWKVRTQVRRLDLAGLDRIIARGEWKSDGFLNGEIRFFGQGGRLRDIELDLQSEEPGGNLNSELLERLAEMMPAGDARGVLLRALGAKATFHFATGLLEMRTDGEDYVLNLLLNGD
ncbi:MAG: hypothetical protein Q7J69_05450, partial [Candidatus Omnitrophota bacterium]|nr:hypothetical protein [Candidatus Omnitrophota bacterium]